MARRWLVPTAAASLIVLCFYLYNSTPTDDVQHLRQQDLLHAPDEAEMKLPRKHGEDHVQISVDPDMAFLRTLGKGTELPSLEEIKTISDKELSYIYHSYLDNIDFLCHRRIRMGKVADGGWEVCDDYEYRPMHPCTVYSFGIRNDFSFDDDIGRLYHCGVYSFDPSMGRPHHKRSQYVNFYGVGLSGDTHTLPRHIVNLAKKNQWKVSSFTEIKALLGHQNKTIDLVKMDIEHSEWHALPSMVANGVLKNVRQLLVEYHLYGPDPSYIRQNMPVMKAIHDLGFRRFHSHLNPDSDSLKSGYLVRRATCYEVYYVNTRLARRRL